MRGCRLRRHARRRRTLLLPLLLALALHLRLSALALHVDAAAEVRALRDGDAWRHDVAVHRSAVADIDLFGGRDVAVDFAEHNDGLREHLCLDLAVGPDRQHVIPKLDLSFDMSFDREVLTAIQLSLADH